MRYYYRKIESGEYKDRFMKVVVDDSTAGTREDPFMVVDALIVDKVDKDNKLLIYERR